MQQVWILLFLAFVELLLVLKLLLVEKASASCLVSAPLSFLVSVGLINCALYFSYPCSTQQRRKLVIFWFYPSRFLLFLDVLQVLIQLRQEFGLSINEFEVGHVLVDRCEFSLMSSSFNELVTSWVISESVIISVSQCFG